MTKTKSKAYSLLATLSIVLSATIGMVLALFTFFDVFTEPDYGPPHGTISVFYVAFCIVAIVAFYALAIGITYILYRLIGKIFESILACNIYECSWKSYADGFYVMRRNDQTRDINLSNLRTGGPAGNTQKTYTVYVELSYRQLDIAIYRMLSQFHSVRYELPQSYIMPDGVSCLSRPKITLRAAIRAKNEMREDETVFFVYHVDYPERKSQLAHEDKRGKVVIIETDSLANCTTPD